MSRSAIGGRTGAWRSFLVDLSGLVVAFSAATAIKTALLAGPLGVDLRHIPFDEPRVYLVEYLTPILVLPVLTWLLWRRGESWMGLGLRRPPGWGWFSAWVAGTATVALGTNAAIRWLPTLWGGRVATLAVRLSRRELARPGDRRFLRSLPRRAHRRTRVPGVSDEPTGARPR